MQVTIDLSDHHVDRLLHWASLCRTLTETQRIYGQLLTVIKDGGLTLDDGLQERLDNNEQELEDIEPAMTALHQAFREAVFKAKYDGMHEHDGNPMPEEVG